MNNQNATVQIRRLLLGLVVGLASATVPWLLFTVFAANIDVAQTGLARGAWTLFLSGALIGLGYALFFRPAADGSIVDLVQGLLLGLFAWLILTLNIYPVLMGSAPLWQADAIAPTFPHLIAITLASGLTGLLYGLAYRWLATSLGLQYVASTPEIATRVVILGGGYAGVAAAEALEKAFRNDASVGLWLINRTNYLLHTPMLSEVAASAVDDRHISPPLRSAFQHVRVVQGEVDRIDRERRMLHLVPTDRTTAHDLSDAAGARSLAFDHLIVAAGSVPHFFGNQSVEKHCYTFKSLDDAVALRNRVIEMFERADAEEDAAQRAGMVTFVVVGGGFAGVELVGALNDFARGITLYYPNIAQDEIRLVLIHSHATILPELSEELGKYAHEKLTARGVEFILETRVTSAEADKVWMGDDHIATNTCIWTAGNRPSPVLEKLGVPLTKRGQLAVNAQLAVPEASGLWAVGDCAQIPDPHSPTRFAPPTAQHAVREGKLAGNNVAAAIRNKPLKAFDFQMVGSLAALGHQIAVAEVFGRRFSGLLAWMMWRMIYLTKLPTLEKRVRVGLDWLLDIFFPPDIVQTLNAGRAHLQRTQDVTENVRDSTASDPSATPDSATPDSATPDSAQTKPVESA